MKKKDWQTVAQVLIGGAVLSVLAAAWGFLSADIWLASTQWLLVAAVLGILGLYARMES